MRSALCALIAFLLSCGAARAGIPFPGQHSAHPKYWPSVHRWVTNYSPYSFTSTIDALASDDMNGVWFGIGPSLEHIASNGSMSQVVMPDNLWEIYAFTRDRSGRLWFSLGQSGRIGTMDSGGRLRTRVVVPRRYYPDIRDIAFDSNGTLWFVDLGRRSIGRLSAGGALLEVPLNSFSAAATATLKLCGDRPYLDGIALDPSTLEWPTNTKSRATCRDSTSVHGVNTRVLPIDRTEIAASTVTPNGDVWLALNGGNAALAITRLSLNANP